MLALWDSDSEETETNKQTNKQTNRQQTNKQTNKQTDNKQTLVFQKQSSTALEILKVCKNHPDTLIVTESRERRRDGIVEQRGDIDCNGFWNKPINVFFPSILVNIYLEHSMQIEEKKLESESNSTDLEVCHTKLQ